MMQAQKVFKTGEITIICDYREKEVISELKKLGARVSEQALKVGDFVVSDRRVAIERKAYSDFIGSIIDGRVFVQTKTLKRNYEKPIIIIEGYSNREITENALKAAIASLLIDYDITLLNTKNPSDTARLIYWIAEKEQTEKKYELAFKIGKKPKEEKKLQEYIVSSIPGVSNILSKRLLESFGNVERIFTADESELQKVQGIGKKLSKNIRKILTKNY